MKKLMIALLSLPLMAMAATEKIDGIEWSFTVKDGKASVEETLASGTVSIPSKLGGFPVVAIGKSAFNSRDDLTSVTIPSSVTTIGRAAFFKCCALSSVIIPSSVTTIEEGAFACCDALTSVTIPSSVRKIGNDAFAICDALTSVTIPDSVTVIGENAFLRCDKLKIIRIGRARELLEKSGFHITGDHVVLSLTSPLPVSGSQTSPLAIKQKFAEVSLARKWEQDMQKVKPIKKELNKLFGVNFGAKKTSKDKSYYNMGGIPAYDYVPEKRFLDFDQYSVMYDFNDEVFFIRAVKLCKTLEEACLLMVNARQAIERKFDTKMDVTGHVESYADITKQRFWLFFKNRKCLCVRLERPADGEGGFIVIVFGADDVVWDAVHEVRRQNPDVDDAL